jgi:hypothetical protein
MKIISLLYLCLLVSGCLTSRPKTYSTLPKKSPSLAVIGDKVSDAQSSNDRAKAHSDKIALAAVGLRSNSQRIDDKAMVVLKWLNHP